MSMFFVVSRDQELLHPEARTSNELQYVVDRVEWEVIDYYKQRDMQSLATYDSFFRYEFGRDPRQEVKVRLIGYDEEEPLESDPHLLEALRRTVADIASWVLRNEENAQGVTSQSQGNRSVTYSGSVPTWREWPNGWSTNLHNFDAKIAGYGI